MTDNAVVITRSKKIQVDEQFSLAPEFSETPGQFTKYQQQAWEVFKKLPFPDDSQEAWKRTSIRGMRLGQLQLADSSIVDSKIPVELTKPLTDDLHGGEILFNGSQVTLQLDEKLAKQGVIFTDLRHAQSEHAEILSKVLQASTTYTEDKFAALAAAFGSNGVLLYIPKNVTVEKPLHSLLWTAGEGNLHAFQVFVYLEENASATYVHETASAENKNEQNLHAALMDVKVGPNSKLNFVELQSLGSQDWNFTHEKVSVDRDAEVDWIFGALGSHLTKNFSDLNLVGQGSTGKMSGFFFTNGHQHLDHDTQQNHMAPNTTSDLLFKGALLGESRSVWQGMIYVAENASKTDGYQANRNLVLSEKARADSIPGLEILTDDVRCTHGATVGKLDAEQIFYLESRGIPRKEAEKLIVEGFFDPIMQRIPFDGVRKRFQDAIEQKMNEY
ncbi:MAG: Fe-S cluster assembly protein SufD [Anaerolineaceae bacterium]|nr:Fe-S cluster assembly protein SufD [Anaerolineaceae bacterium]